MGGAADAARKVRAEEYTSIVYFLDEYILTLIDPLHSSFQQNAELVRAAASAVAAHTNRDSCC